jgi:putative SOS response-associated peptidase YedK
MCGRYRLSRRKQMIAEYFETDTEVDWEPRYNIAPSQQVGIIRQSPSRPDRHFSLARWGLIPSWASDASISSKTINARSETVVTKPAFRDAFSSRRCLLPADGFFEWRRQGKEKQPFHFGMQDDSLFAFAGLWDRWRDPAGAVIESCSILTTTPNSLLADMHDRMPVILRQESYALWPRCRLQGCEGSRGGSSSGRRGADEMLSGQYKDQRGGERRSRLHHALAGSTASSECPFRIAQRLILAEPASPSR